LLLNLKGAAKILGGLALLARGKAEGLTAFGNTADALTTSLAPLIAFPFVGAALLALNGQPEAAALAFLSRLCVVLAISAATYEFARLAGRDSLWLRTATALNWSFWILIPLLLIAGILGAVLVSCNIPELMAERLLMALMAAYMLWYNWFTVRHGLQIGRFQAIALVAITNGIIALLVLAPMALDLTR
jgi:hypothetical protein